MCRMSKIGRHSCWSGMMLHHHAVTPLGQREAGRKSHVPPSSIYHSRQGKVHLLWKSR